MANGTLTYSAWVPSIMYPRIHPPPPTHWPKRPSRHIGEDIGLFGRLVGANHWSPLEHVATPDPANVALVEVRDPDREERVLSTRRVALLGKWAGWQQYRHVVEATVGWNSHV
jgi:hypothetical protein